ncbi:proteasome-activating nucleotidase [Candidatus Woesearchaeota archaeon]|nr:proteasome-activating nucleotidase [Candidatus Woesearchaeota archaeon]
MEVNSRSYDDVITNSNLSIESENKVLKATIIHLKNELNKFRKKPLILCHVKNIIDDKIIIKLPNGNNFLVEVSNHLVGKLKVNDEVFVEQRSLMIVDKLESHKSYDVENFVIIEKPNISWEDIGGLKEQIMEIKEVIELPLTKPHIFEKVGIEPPKGILLYGPPGSGKTLLAKAVAASTKATFIEVVASELNQKYIGEGAKLVKDIFKLAKERAPSIIFVDEIDALASERMDVGTSGEREVQRTFMQFLSELDGFEPLSNVKLIGATNRIDVLDPALLRPGRLDRLIEIDLPNEREREEILKIHIKNMNLNNVDLNQLVKNTESFSGAEIKAICTEAGYIAIRKNRYNVNNNDFVESIKKVRSEEQSDHISMFG